MKHNKLMKKLFYTVACAVLAAVLTVPAFANAMVIETVDVGGLGIGYVSALTSRTYAETEANDGGTAHSDPEANDDDWNWLDVELFIESAPVAYKLESGTGKTNAWVSYNGSGESVETVHIINRGNERKTASMEVNP